MELKNKSRTTYSLLNIAMGIGGYFLNTVMGFICRVIFTRCLSADYLGLSGLFNNLLSMLSLAELGIGSAIIYALYKPIANRDYEKISTLMKFYSKAYRTIGVVVAVVGLAMMPFLQYFVGTPKISENIYVIFLMYLFCTASTYFFTYKGALITAHQQNYVVLGIFYIQSIVQNTIQIVILIVTHNFYYYLIAQIICVLLANFTLSFTANKKYPYLKEKEVKPFDKEEKKILFKNIKAVVIVKISGLLVNNTSNIILSFLKGITIVGLSSNYTLLSTTLNSLLNQIFTGVTASVGNLNVNETAERKVKTFNFINLANFWLFGWAAIALIVLSNDIVHFLFGPKYLLDISIPFILALNFYMVGMQNAVWTFKNTMGLFRYGRYLLLLTAAINIVLSYWFGTMWGLFGIFFAMTVSRLVTNTWYDPYAVFKYGLFVSPWRYFKKFIQYFVILVLTLALTYFSCYYISLPFLFLTLLVKTVITCLVPNIVFF
ncbi:MAG: oligosaccharide flippase family protein, partial [Bacillota bacterium]|nr:oligosaccharide flippase family protein [Bacillota bacterium]